MVWLTISVGILVVTYIAFKTSDISKKDKKAEKKRHVVEPFFIWNLHTASIVIPKTTKSFDHSTRILQVSTITRESFKLIAFGWGWIALASMFLFVVLTGTMWFSDYYNIP